MYWISEAKTNENVELVLTFPRNDDIGIYNQHGLDRSDKGCSGKGGYMTFNSR